MNWRYGLGSAESSFRLGEFHSNVRDLRIGQLLAGVTEVIEPHESPIQQDSQGLFTWWINTVVREQDKACTSLDTWVRNWHNILSTSFYWPKRFLRQAQTEGVGKETPALCGGRFKVTVYEWRKGETQLPSRLQTICRSSNVSGLKTNSNNRGRGECFPAFLTWRGGQITQCCSREISETSEKAP